MTAGAELSAAARPVRVRILRVLIPAVLVVAVPLLILLIGRGPVDGRNTSSRDGFWGPKTATVNWSALRALRVICALRTVRCVLARMPATSTGQHAGMPSGMRLRADGRTDVRMVCHGPSRHGRDHGAHACLHACARWAMRMSTHICTLRYACLCAGAKRTTP